MREPIHSEAELRHYDRTQRDQQYSYDLTKQLTFFIVSAELVFCGYILLNAKTLGALEHSSTLFLLASLAALFGIIWRFFYNATYHAEAHGRRNWFSNLALKAGGATYYLYVSLSLIFFIFLLAVGYSHISAIEDKANAPSIGAAPAQLAPSENRLSQKFSTRPAASREPDV